MAAEVTLWSERPQPLTGLPLPMALGPGRGIPIISGCENHQGLWLSETEGTGDLDTAGLKT